MIDIPRRCNLKKAKMVISATARLESPFCRGPIRIRLDGKERSRPILVWWFLFRNVVRFLMMIGKGFPFDLSRIIAGSFPQLHFSFPLFLILFFLCGLLVPFLLLLFFPYLLALASRCILYPEDYTVNSTTMREWVVVAYLWVMGYGWALFSEERWTGLDCREGVNADAKNSNELHESP
jgi:hypothetical protein